MSIKQQYLKIGDFAKLCGVSKDTLFHYERLGLLKPEIRMANGYRLYSINQAFTFDIIAILKETGTSLKEIKKYIENLDTDNFIALLDEKYEMLEKEHMEIEHMQKVLKNTISLMRETVAKVCTEPVIKIYDEQYLLVVDFTQDDSEKDRLEKINRHYRYCLDKGLSETLTSGFINNKASLENRQFDDADCFFCEVGHKLDSEMLYIKPKGKHAVLDHQGPYETIAATFEKLLAFIDKESLTIAGNAYIYEVLGFISVKDPEKYLVKIAIEVA